MSYLEYLDLKVEMILGAMSNAAREGGDIPASLQAGLREAYEAGIEEKKEEIQKVCIERDEADSVRRRLQSELDGLAGVTRPFLRALFQDFVDTGRGGYIKDEMIEKALRALAEKHDVKDIEQVVALAFSENGCS